MPLPVTALFAGLLAFWMIFLQAKVVGFRRGNDVSLGDGGHVMGERLIRAHGNAAENVPIFLILLGLVEGLGAPTLLLAALGVVFLVGRVLHGVHFFELRKGFLLRFYGMVMTLTGIGLAALAALGYGLVGL